MPDPKNHGRDSSDLKRMLLGGLPKQQARTRALDDLFGQLGATGTFPQGLMSRNDEGGLQMAVMAAEDKVVLAFGTEVSWIGFGPTQAREIAKLLSQRADDVEREQERRSKW